MEKYPTGPTICSADPSCQVLINSLTDWPPILVFAFWGFASITCFTFQLWRMKQIASNPIKPFVIKRGISKRSESGHTNPSDINNSEHLHIDVEDESEIHITGYSGTAFGESCFILCCLVSLHWIVLFILIFFDTYNKCEVGGIDNLCVYGNHGIFGTYSFNAEIFFVIWWLAAIWFTGWVFNRDRVHNWFRVPCDISQAHVVYIWARDKKEILSVNVFFIVKLVRKIKCKLMPPETHGHYEIISVQTTKNGQHFFLFQGQRYLIKGNIVHAAYLNVGSHFSDFHKCEEGLGSNEVAQRLEIVGPNEIPFKPESLLQSAYEELFSLFHVYQLIMYLLWFWNSYLFVATILSSIVVLSASITIYTRNCSQRAIAKVTALATEVEVFRNKSWLKTDSRRLVPGDVMKIISSLLLPCDLMIIKGSCVCDESSLTGEATPVQKYNAPNTSSVYEVEGAGAHHTLFSGTRVLQAGSHQDDLVLAVVTETGMSTSKGQLLAAILYPEQTLFKYDEELAVVVFLLLMYATVCFIISLIFQNKTGSQTLWMTKWIYCMAVISQIMSPLLPVALEIGQLHAVERLKDQGIFCLNPKRIAIAGKIRVFCFDKTGTLTKEGLDFIGVQSIASLGEPEPSFGPILSLAKGDHVDHVTLHGLATCHSIAKFGSQYVGNQVEVKMFEAVGWELVEGYNEPDHVCDGVGERLKIWKRNEFDYARATMSVIMEDSEGAIHVYCKGSFEKIKALCIEKSLPEDYLEVAQGLALDGCYVLALAHRSLDIKAGMMEILNIARNDLEAELEFVAFIIFRNELKPDSQAAIKALKDGEVRPIMVTGDNAQCGKYIACKCDMVAPHAHTILGDLNEDNSLFWKTMTTNPESSPKPLRTEELLQHHQKGLEAGLVELAVTGKAFNMLRKAGMMDQLLFYTRIFARFTPEDKVLVANMFRDCGLIVGMCGDGGNDCGALRTAHVGIALSEAEASVVSPFTSRHKSIVSVVDLLREGRCALHTSFACYKFLIMYGLMFSILKLCFYWYGVIACEMDYLFIDGVAVLTLGYTMTCSYSTEKLGKERPTSSLLGPTNVASIFGVWAINIFFMSGAIAFMGVQPDYVQFPAIYSHGADWWTLGDNWETTVLFFTMYLQFITSAFVFTYGSTFRKTVFCNWPLVACYGALMALMSCALLLPYSGFTSLWHVASEQFNRANTTSPVWAAYQKAGGSPSPGMSFDFRLHLWLLIMTGLAAAMIWQRVVPEGPVAKFVATKFPSNRLKFLT